MRDTVALGAEVLFPGLFTSSLHLRQPVVPGRTMVRSHKVCFDVAYLMLTGERFRAAWRQGGMSRWSWADSSPQAGRDWFQCKEMHALNRDLPALAAAVDALIIDQAQDTDSMMTSDEAQACNAVIAKALTIHMKVPAAKGEGHSGTEHLAGCWALVNFWEAGSISGLERICSEHVSFTSDMGVDSAIRGFHVHAVADVLPAWFAPAARQQLLLQPDLGGEEDLPGDGDAASAAQAPALAFPARPPLRPLLEFAVEVPGSLHILTNLPKDLESRLHMWQAHMDKLKKLAPLLTVSYHRERLRATCLADYPEEAKQFLHFSATLYVQRWLEVYKFVSSAQPLIQILAVRWNVHSYVHGFSSHKADQDKDGHFRPHEVKGVLDDPVFHAYNQLLMSIGLILRQLSSWLEACPCHGRYVRECGKWRKAPLKWKQIFPNMVRPSCPLAGCRAPELAAGAVQDMLETVSDFCHADLLQKMPTGLREEDRVSVFRDFGLAKSYFLMGLQMKFDCWSRLPWCLAALGHWSREARIAGARRALHLFDDSCAQGFGASKHHPLANRLLTPGTKLRFQVEACLLDGALGPELQLEAARLKFMPVAERAPYRPVLHRTHSSGMSQDQDGV
jgi:predicted secreted protein